MPRKTMIPTLLLVLAAVSSFPFGLYECFDGYYKGLYKCLSIFDDQRRQDCFSRELQTLKASLDAASADPRSNLNGVRVFFLGFFRNERKLVPITESFTVPTGGTYFLTVVNGNPLDGRSRAEKCVLVLWNDKGVSPLAELDSSEPQVEREIKLEAGKTYFVSADRLDPVPAYVTVLITDKKLPKE